MLRDEFAKAALTGLAGSLALNKVYDIDLLAKQAYEIADAMVRQSKIPHKTTVEIVAEFEALKIARPVALPDMSWMDADALLVDPPSGWRYGFPKVWNRKTHPDMTAWLIENGYPEKDAKNKNLTNRFMSVPQETAT